METMELVYSENYFNLVKIFVLKLFRLMENQTDNFKLQQRSVIKFLVAEKCKLCEVYDVYGEAKRFLQMG